jgi:hypothetical protein
MSVINTYPNSFKTDSIYVDSELLYNFNSSIDIQLKDPSDISNSIYSEISVNNPTNNVKFNNVIYSFKGIYITTNKDLIDENTNYTYALIVKCVNYNLDKYLYIVLPVSKVNTNTELNDVFENNVLKDLNMYIPMDKGFYSYKTIGINEQISDIILFKDSTLTINHVEIEDFPVVQRTSVNVPLTISKKPAMKVSRISNSYSENDIYIDCQPVDETQQENVIELITNYQSIYSFFENVFPYIFVFCILYMILKYKSIQKMFTPKTNDL